MNASPSLEVVMCTYNGAAYLEDQLDSIAAQRRRPDRMTIVDDRSSDDTLRIAQEWAERAPFPVEVSQNVANLGYVQNFAGAIASATGDLIALSDQDDVWHPDKLARLTQVFADDPAVLLAFSDAALVDGELRPLGTRLWPSVWFTAEKQQAIRRGDALDVLLAQHQVTGATAIFRRELRDRALPIPPDVFHDAWLALVAAAVGRVVALDEPLIDYRQHGGNQIGARRRSLRERLTVPHEQRRRDQRGMLVHCARLAERLAEFGNVPDARREGARQAVHFWTTRAGLPAYRIGRVVPVLRQWRAGGYHRFADGARTAVFDVLL